jgi:hypothetical protein
MPFDMAWGFNAQVDRERDDKRPIKQAKGKLIEPKALPAPAPANEPARDASPDVEEVDEPEADGESAEEEPAEDLFIAPFPVHSLPRVLREMAIAISESINVHVNLSATAVLGVCSAAIGKGLYVQSGPDQCLRANLYIMGAAISGAGKSEGSRPAAAPFWDCEANKLTLYHEEIEPGLIAEQRRLKCNLHHLESVLAKEKKSATSDEDSLRKKQEDAVKRLQRIKDELIAPCMVMEDVTQEEGAVVLANNGEKVFSFSSEASKAIANLEGLYNRMRVPDENLLVKGYSGDPHIVHRIGRPTVHLTSPCITLLWYLQPDLLERLLGNERLRVGGLFPRVLICDTQLEPTEIPATLNPIPAEVRSTYNSLINDLLVNYWDAQKPYEISVTGEAREMIRAYHNEHIARRKNTLADVNSFAARWHEQAFKLGINHQAGQYGKAAHHHVLSPQTMADAITIHRWFVGEQLRLLANARRAAFQEFANKLATFLGEVYPDGTSLRRLHMYHNRRPEEVKQLARKFPHMFELFKGKESGPGRPSPCIRCRK